MAASRKDIAQWFHVGSVDGYNRMIVWCDTFSHEDYPEYTLLTGESLRAYVNDGDGKNMQTMMEVYDLTIDPLPQLNSDRAYNF